MGAAPIPSFPRYRFADLTLDVGQRRLWRGDSPIELSKLTFALLRVLVEAAPNVVTHAELAEQVWGPRRIVTPENLAKRVMRLRQALGDRVDAPRYVEGLRGQGYRLIPAVESAALDGPGATAPELAPDSPAARAVSALQLRDAGTLAAPELRAGPPPDDPHASTPARPSPFSRRVAIAAGVAFAALLAAGAYFLQQPVGEPVPKVAEAGGATKIVVLPFANLSSDPERQHFIDGLTDELMIGLQRLPGLKVTSRLTSFALRDSARSAKQIAADLGVQYVLEGSVGSDGGRLRVLAQLSDASGFSVLPYSYEGEADDLFDVQDEIVAAIAAAVRVPLGVEQTEDRAGTKLTEAYELYITAKLECVLGNRTPDGFVRTLARLDEALRIDPKFARAWMFKSTVYVIRSTYVADPAADLAAAEEAATRAIGLAPDNGDGYNARALLRGMKGDWLGAARDYERAHATGVSEFPHDVALLVSTGRIGKARARIEALLEEDPLNEDLLGFLAISHEIMGDEQAADDVYRRGRLLYEPWQFGDAVGLWIRLGRGRAEPPYDAIAIAPRFAPFAERMDEPEAARELLARAAHEPQYQDAGTLVNFALWAAYFDDPDLALALLSRGVKASGLLAYVAWLPAFEEVRQLPGFKTLLLDVGLVDYWRATGWPDVCRPLDTGDFDCAGASLDRHLPNNSG